MEEGTVPFDTDRQTLQKEILQMPDRTQVHYTLLQCELLKSMLIFHLSVLFPIQACVNNDIYGLNTVFPSTARVSTEGRLCYNVHLVIN